MLGHSLIFSLCSATDIPRSGKLLLNKFTLSSYKMGILYQRTRWRKHWKLFLTPAGMETLTRPSFKN
ncbi:hypothetical protein OIU77_010178 [Salix suchowensis]|uniref:Uncharacterized protein n=1 Tax=Salix suchowensis TaxID=1278906 RepID=A0ABQ9A847_9ROSI|nr:hypothetical protein OIU77_010178 [Salix suchowensis]